MQPREVVHAEEQKDANRPNTTLTITLSLNDGSRTVSMQPTRQRHRPISLRTKLSNIGCALLCFLCAAALAYAGSLAGRAEHERLIHRTPEEEKRDENSELPSELVVGTIVSFLVAICFLAGAGIALRANCVDEIQLERKDEKDIDIESHPVDTKAELTEGFGHRLHSGPVSLWSRQVSSSLVDEAKEPISISLQG